MPLFSADADALLMPIAAITPFFAAAIHYFRHCYFPLLFHSFSCAIA